MSREKSRDICILQNINTCDKLHKKNRKLNNPVCEDDESNKFGIIGFCVSPECINQLNYNLFQKWWVVLSIQSSKNVYKGVSYENVSCESKNYFGNFYNGSVAM